MKPIISFFKETPSQEPWAPERIYKNGILKKSTEFKKIAWMEILFEINYFIFIGLEMTEVFESTQLTEDLRLLKFRGSD